MGQRSARIRHFITVGLMLLPCHSLIAAPATGPADDPAASIAEIQAMKPPELDQTKLGDANYRKSFNTENLKFVHDRAERVKSLYARFPHEAGVKKFMLDRWVQMARFGEQDAVIQETDPILAATTEQAERNDLLYVRAEAWAWPMAYPKDAARAVDEFLQAAPDDIRGGELLFFLAWGEPDPHKQAETYHRAADGKYAASPYATVAAGKAIQADAIGKPVELSFQDVTTGKSISIQKDLKGKIVVLIFWATGCGPCKASMPGEIDLYNQYKNKGVEFIGVSLDEPESAGGLKALKAYLKDNPIPWPQYYQGNGIDSEFSSKFGVASVPQIFIIDRDGNFACTADGRLQIALEEMLAKK